MRKLIHTGICCGLLVILTELARGSSNPRLTLAEAIAEAQARNPELKSLTAVVAGARGG